MTKLDKLRALSAARRRRIEELGAEWEALQAGACELPSRELSAALADYLGYNARGLGVVLPRGYRLAVEAGHTSATLLALKAEYYRLRRAEYAARLAVAERAKP